MKALAEIRCTTNGSCVARMPNRTFRAKRDPPEPGILGVHGLPRNVEMICKMVYTCVVLLKERVQGFHQILKGFYDPLDC